MVIQVALPYRTELFQNSSLPYSINNRNKLDPFKIPFYLILLITEVSWTLQEGALNLIRCSEKSY